MIGIWGLIVFSLHLNVLGNPTSDKIYTLAIPPDEHSNEYLNLYSTLASYLTEKIDQPTKLIVAKSYSDLVRRFCDKEFDLTLFGGASFLRAHEICQAQPLVVRDIDIDFKSVLITHAKEEQPLQHFKGSKIVFNDKLSTSGYLMPKYFLGENEQIILEDFFSNIYFSGSHEQTIREIISGQADIGAVNSQTLMKMLENGKINDKDITVVWESPPYPNYVWATQADLSETTRIKMLNAFLSLDKDQPIMKALGARAFFPTYVNDFYSLNSNLQALKNMGM